MSFGFWEWKVCQHFPDKLYTLLFGVLELHSHIRFRAIKRFFQPRNRTVEIGAGIGIMSIGYYYMTKKPIIALTYTEEEFSALTSKVAKLGLDKAIIIGQDDAQVLSSLKDGWAEQILLIDVLEHVEDDLKTLQEINRSLCIEGHLIISCPTHNYPLFFGLSFDTEIGHLRHYKFEDLKCLLEKTGFEILDYIYYTNHFNSLLCKIWYTKLRRPLIKFLIFPLLNMLSILEVNQKEPFESSSIVISAFKRLDLMHMNKEEGNFEESSSTADRSQVSAY